MDIGQPPRNDDSKSMTVGDVGNGNCHMFAADGDHIDFFDSLMYNNYRKFMSECELRYYENDA